MEIQIKTPDPCTPAHIDALANILIAAWHSGFRGILPEETIKKYTNYESCKSMFHHILSSCIGTMYLAELDGQPAGLLYWLPEQDHARIEALLTIPEVWGKGVAAALMRQALEDARCPLSVWPFVENHRARRFYEKHGFIPTDNFRTGDAEEMEYVHQ